MTNNPPIILSTCISACEPDPDIDLVEWANRHMVLTKESSIEPGQYRTSRTPYVEEILRELSPQSPTKEVIVIKPTQFGFTTLANIFLFGTADLYPGPALLVQPTDEMVQDHSKDKIAPSLSQIDVLRDKIRAPKSRDSGNTIKKKQFPGGSWTFTGSNSPVSARSKSIRYLILDDLDGFVLNVGGEGDPVALFSKRTDAFGSRKKIYKNSTPTLKDSSLIHREYESSSQGKFEVPCPFCGEYQYLEFGGPDADFGIKFEHDKESLEVSDIWYECCHCHQRIDEWHKTEMLAAGRYIHKYPHRKKRGFKINALYSPMGWLSWAQVAEEFLAAKKDPVALQVWTNTRMAEPWEEKGDRPEWETLKARCEPYQSLSAQGTTVPSGVRLLTAGTDVQQNRLEISIYGWGKGEECWLLYHIPLHGNPLHDEVWGQHDQLLEYAFRHPDGSELRIVSAGVDSGDGNTTQAVRNYCRLRSPKVFALKGMSTAGKPVVGLPTKQDVNWRGQKIEGGVEMWPIGTDTAKATLYNRLKLGVGDPGSIHFYLGLEDEFFKQLTAEKIVTRFNKGYPVREWHNVRASKRNEALDCWVYAYAAAIRAGLPYINFDRLAGTAPAKPIIEKRKRKQRAMSNRASRRW